MKSLATAQFSGISALAPPNPIARIAEGGAVSDGESLRGKVMRLENEMLKYPQTQIETTHYFALGTYAREIRIPKGTVLTGKIHRTTHINILSKGEITVLTDEGMKTLKAPCTFVAQAGTKRAGYAHEDCVWTTIHGSFETDIAKLEEELIAPTFEDLASSDVQMLMGVPKCLS